MPISLFFRIEKKTRIYDRLQTHGVMVLIRAEEESISKSAGFRPQREYARLNGYIGIGLGIICVLPPIPFKATMSNAVTRYGGFAQR